MFRGDIYILLLSLFGLAGGCTSTRPSPPVPPPVVAPAPAFQSFWRETESKEPGAIVIKLSEQRAYFYRGEQLVGASKISTGRRGFETPPGQYKVTQKDRHHVSNLYGDFVDAEGSVVKRNVDASKSIPPEGTTFSGAKMPYFLRFHRGYGLHAGRVPDHRASHGCVRLPSSMARHFFENASYGMPVSVEE